MGLTPPRLSAGGREEEEEGEEEEGQEEEVEEEEEEEEQPTVSMEKKTQPADSMTIHLTYIYDLLPIYNLYIGYYSRLV